MMKSIFTLITSLLIPLCAIAENVQGTITDNENNPIDGAYVLLLQTGFHTHSDEFGKFTIQNTEVGDTLQIMYLGYETQKIPVSSIKNKNEVNIELKAANFELGEVIIGQNAKKSNIISTIDIELSPVTSSQDVLKKVPGLFIGQHAGGGKAEQIFLRGFDIDHGTDVHITVDGMPVNMVSHAHGQGYADMHFLIPETIDQLDYGKGPYYADKGNFATAGYVQFNTKDQLDRSMVSLEVGRFGSLRTLGMFNILNKENHDVYVASEYISFDGPFESSQNFKRANFMGKYTGKLSNNKYFSITASHFTSDWDASGQIPVRSVEDGSITRFGAIDDTEGGKTSRTNIAVNFDHLFSSHTFIKNNLFYSLYDFELFSNFTFFLEDPVNGDQIRQKEKRQIYGFESVLNHSLLWNDTDILLQLGGGLRNDKIKGNELSRTLNRVTTLENIQLGDVDETNLYSFVNMQWDIGKILIEPSVRFDYFQFTYQNSLDSLYSKKSRDKFIFSPKINTVYNVNNSIQLFLKGGIGFHSNDTRTVLEDGDIPVLPAAYGADFGTVLKPTKRMIANVALWYLFLEQEFVYVGDAGVVEPSGRTRRLGVDVGLRYQFNDWIFGRADANYAFARSVDDEDGENLIPLAPIITSTVGLDFKREKFNASVQFRYLGDRPANEDNSIVAEGYAITDLNANYNFKHVTVGFAIENLFNQEWNETQFATESRLFNEPQSVEEIHFTPGIPFQIRGVLKYKF